MRRSLLPPAEDLDRSLPEVLERGEFTVVNVPLNMAHGMGEARVTYDSQGKIAGLFLLRPGVPVP